MDMQSLIPADRIVKHGPKRLKGRKHRWDREKNTFVEIPKKKVVDRRDQEKALAALASRGPAVAESPKFDMGKYRPLPGRALISVGDEIPVEGGVVIPESLRQRRKERRVLLVGPGEAEFKVGDLVLLDKNAHQKPVMLDRRADYVLVWHHDIAAIVNA